MYPKALFFILVLLLPAHTQAAFYIHARVPVHIYSVSAPSTTTVVDTTHRLLDLRFMHKHSQKSIGIVSLLCALAGVGAAITVALMWVALPLIAGIAVAAMFAFGAAAYITGYACIVSHPGNVPGIIGFVLGIVESIPLIIVGSIIVGAIEITKFIFRKKHRSAPAADPQQLQKHSSEK